MITKAKSQSAQVAKPELLAFASFFGPVPQRIEEPTTNRLAVGWNPTRPATTLISPVRSANCLRGLASGKPKAEFTRLTVILDLSPEESKGSNDVPQLPYRDGEGWFLRTEQGSAVQVPAVR